MTEPPIIYPCPHCSRTLNRLPFADYPVFLCPVCNAGWRYDATAGWVLVAIRLDEQEQVSGTVDMLQ